MRSQTDIQKIVDEVLGSVDGLQRAEPRPFFYTRLKARLDNQPGQSVWERLDRVISRPAVAFLSVVLILLLNVFVILATNTNNNDQPPSSEMALTEEYRHTLAFYDFEN